MMKIGFACAWWKAPEKTWSGTPWGLRRALRQQAHVVDLGVEYSAARSLLKYVYARRRRGYWTSVYKWSSSRDRMMQRKLQSALRATSVDAVIEVGDLARLDVPFYVYQDLSFDVLKRYYDLEVGIPGQFKGIDLDTIERRWERQQRIYESADGILAMSEWFANTLVEWSGVPRDKVTVVYAGLNSIEPGFADHGRADADLPGRKPAKLLFVGRDFFRKGGEIVVAALGQLRRNYSPDIQLTVVGPDKWPLRSEIPEGVVFLGDRTTAEVARLYHTHDLFVMPSRFEAFGIAFREALAHGVPVIGRSAFAMPEIIVPGRNGALVDSDDPAELASAIVAVIENPAVRQFTLRTAGAVRARFSWDAVAKRMLTALANSA